MERLSYKFHWLFGNEDSVDNNKDDNGDNEGGNHNGDGYNRSATVHGTLRFLFSS